MAASKTATVRLQKEMRQLLKEPIDGILTTFNPSNILDWHYVIIGPADSPYAGGEYHGIVRFPSDYPYKPPEIQMYTPSGRFEPNKAICMSMSNYHPETWNPLWSVSSILRGLLSFMLEETASAGTVEASEAQRRELAAASIAFNQKNKMFCKLFEKDLKKLPHRRAPAQSVPRAAASREATVPTTSTTTTSSSSSSALDASADGSTTSASDESSAASSSSSSGSGSLAVAAATVVAVLGGVAIAATQI